MLGDVLLLTITSAIALFVALVVALAHTVERKTKISFIVFCVPLVLWQVTIFIADSVEADLLLWNNLVFLWPTIGSLGCFLFVGSLRHQVLSAEKRLRERLVLGVVAGLTLVQVSAIAANKLFTSITYNPIADIYIFDRGPLYPLYIAGLVSVLLSAVIRLLIYSQKSEPYSQERRAFKIVLTTIAVAAAYGITTNAVMPVVTDTQQFIFLGLFTVDILAIGVAFSIIRYHFLDIRTYVFRAAGYLVAFACITLIYVGVAGIVVGDILQVPISPSSLAILSLVTLMLAVSFHPLQVYFNKLTKRLFFRDYYDPQDVIDKIGKTLIGTVNIIEIQKKSKAILKDALRPSSIVLLLKGQHDKEGQRILQRLLESNISTSIINDLTGERFTEVAKMLRDEDAAVVVRLRTNREDIGFMLLGPRLAGVGYTLGDVHLLELIASQLAVGLQNAFRFEEIKEFNRTLEQKIEGATKELRQKNQRLRVLDQTKDDFISMASHQLRTPLTSVKGYISMVLDGDAGKITDTQRKLLNQSFVSSQRMVYLISDLLNVSRLRTGKFVIEPVASNLAEVIEDEVEQLQETAKGRDLHLDYKKPEHFPALMIDENKLRQVIMNFIDNAIYYTPGGGHITINLVDKPQAIEFTVVDDGIGVPKAEQHHLFGKFYRAHNAKRARPDGTGLGLFMAKKVIIAQGGAVIFRSQEGKGSTFGFTFPKHKLVAVQRPAQKKSHN